MIRRLASALVLAALSAAPAFGQGAESLPPGSDDHRFQFHKSDDGFVRLDMRTGQVSTCRPRSAGWACEAAPEERAALEAEIARLQGESAGLKKALLDRGLPLPQGAAPAPRGEGDARGPGQADLDRMVASVEKAWRRMVEMLTALQKDWNKN